MSYSTSITQPPGGTSIPPLAAPAADAAMDETIRRLRAEAASTDEPARQARLLSEMGEVEERAGDDAAAARDYLAAYDADSTFREPLEGLARLLEKRPSLKTLARLFDALVDVASAPDERVRALLMRAAHLTDTAADIISAEESAREATLIEGAPVAEAASAWFALEILAGRTGDATTRANAIAERARNAGDPTWRGLLLADRARMAAAAGDLDGAIAFLELARTPDSQAVWGVTTLLEQLLRDHEEVDAAEARLRAERYAGALEAIAGLVHSAIVDATRGDALGVPRWAREPGRAVDAWLRAAEGRRALGQLDAAAAALNRALFLVDRMEGADQRLAEAAVAQARMRLAEQTGDTALAAQLAAKRLVLETDGGLGAALAMRVAEHAAAEGDARSAVDALGRAIANDSACLPARALQLDILADANDGAAFAAQLESFAEHLATDEARGRAFLLAAYTWAVRAEDTSSAKIALSQATMFGVSPETTSRLARTLATIAGDAAWYEEATRRLTALPGTDGEELSLYAELVRSRDARGDTDGAAKALRDLGEMPRGAWFARVLEAFSPPPASPTRDPADGGGNDYARAGAPAPRARAALDELVAHEADPAWANALGMVAVMRAHALGDLAGARQKLAQLVERSPDDPVLIAYLGDLDRAAGDHDAAARVAAAAAAATSDAELAVALRLEAALELWRGGERKTAVEEMTSALEAAPEAVSVMLGWAAWGAAPNTPDERRRALHHAERAGRDAASLALEWFGAELATGDADAAAAALASTEPSTESSQGLAADMARLLAPAGSFAPSALDTALDRIEGRGPDANLFVAAERARIARESGDAEGLVRAARGWFEAGGGLPASIEWLAASTTLDDSREEMQARLAAAASLSGPAQEAMLASAAILQPRIDFDKPARLAPGAAVASRLANLELAPPGCDPRRRAAVLEELDGALGDDASIDARALAAWARLTARDFEGAKAGFAATTAARPTDLASWVGLRLCGDRTGDKALRARAAAELGARCHDAARGAAFWEESALLCLELGEAAKADEALEASFARDPSRSVAFDRMFRRIRDRKDNAKLLTVITRRLEATDDPKEIQKLFWEQARALRETGDQDAALKALEHVTLLDPDHVGALALVGEINLRRGRFDDAASALARLAMLDGAPARNRVTAGVAAVDIYENKLTRFDKALEVLLSLHQAKLSTLPVRERLARAAARTGSWSDATSILDELMRERPTAAGRIEAARLAMAIHRDRLGDAQGAAAAIVKLLEEDPADGEGLEMLRVTTHPIEVRERLLVSARAALAAVVAEHPTDVGALSRLVFVARGLKDDGLAQAALGALSTLGAGDAQTEQAFAQLAARKQRTPQNALPPPVLESALAPGDLGPVASLFAVLGPTLAEALGPSLQACGVGRRDRVDPRSGLALRNEIAAWAGAFGVRDFELYVGGKDPLGIQGVPGEPPAIVVGAGVNAPLAPLTRARVARELIGIVRGTTITRWRDDVTIAAIVVAACRLSDVRIETPQYAVLAEVEKLLGKAIARRMRKAIPELCKAVVASGADARAWSKRALASQDRFSVIASGDPGVVLSEVLSVPVDRLAQAVPGNTRAEELLRFALSPSYQDVRRALGLEVSA